MTTIDRESAVECAMDTANPYEECQRDSGCSHARCIQARRIAANLRALPAATPAPVSVEELAEAIKQALMFEGHAAALATWHPWVAGPAAVTAARVAIERLGGRGKP